MTYLAVAVMILLGVSVIALGFGGADPPHRIQTFARSSPEERAFDRRAQRFQAVGFASVGLALLIGVIGALELLV
jgi:hypothetical protein